MFSTVILDNQILFCFLFAVHIAKFSIYDIITKEYTGEQTTDLTVKGKPVVVTLDAGLLTLASEDGSFSYRVPFVNMTWDVHFSSIGKVNWIVNDPCIPPSTN